MIEDELVKIWQSSPNQERAKFEKSRLIIDVQSTVDEFHKRIRNRDLREIIAIIICIPIFAVYTFTTAYLITRIASVLIIVWGVYVYFRLRKAKQQKPTAFHETYQAYLLKTRDYLKIQKHLLDSVMYWYILPGFLLVSMFLLAHALDGRVRQAIFVGVMNVVLAIVTYDLNKKAVKKEFIPRLEKVDELIRVLEKEN